MLQIDKTLSWINKSENRSKSKRNISNRKKTQNLALSAVILSLNSSSHKRLCIIYSLPTTNQTTCRDFYTEKYAILFIFLLMNESIVPIYFFNSSKLLTKENGNYKIKTKTKNRNKKKQNNNTIWCMLKSCFSLLKWISFAHTIFTCKQFLNKW